MVALQFVMQLFKRWDTTANKMFFLMKVNSEYYTGWIDIWGEKHSVASTEDVIRSLKDQLDYGANVNLWVSLYNLLQLFVL